MRRNVLELVRGMDRNNIELQIAFQCAPLLAGLKPSNLLMIRGEDMEQVRGILKRAGISYFVVARIRDKTAVLLFDREQLEGYLREDRVWQIFQKLGYREFSLGKVLYGFRLHYEEYLRREAPFPHEMGLLLGYPVEDVEGYIRNDGENCLYTGDWKVYENLSEKLQLFGKFEAAREYLIQMLSQGIGLAEITRNHTLAQAAEDM